MYWDDDDDLDADELSYGENDDDEDDPLNPWHVQTREERERDDLALAGDDPDAELEEE